MSGRIAVGVDGSEGARAALAWAVDEARLRDATVVAVHAWHLPSMMVPGPFGAAPIVDDETVERVRKAAEEILDRELAAIDASGVQVEPAVVTGSPASALMQTADGADLLVVGTRGHGGFSGLVLGSVSQQVSHHAPCPVVIVPHSAAGDR